jgi:hypothetical protein
LNPQSCCGPTVCGTVATQAVCCYQPGAGTGCTNSNQCCADDRGYALACNGTSSLGFKCCSTGGAKAGEVADCCAPGATLVDSRCVPGPTNQCWLNSDCWEVLGSTCVNGHCT